MSMLKLFAKNRTKNKGFTLIELLVVIAIIGVLSSIVLASLNSARKKARDTRRITDLKQIQLALELYFDGQSNQYPAASATCTGVPTTGAGENNGLQDLVIQGYIPQISRDPLSNSGTPICYKYAALTSGPRITYHLGALIEEATNAVLTGDKDQAVTAGWTNDFNGTSAGAVNNRDCDATAGTPQGQASPTEKCYDVTP